MARRHDWLKITYSDTELAKARVAKRLTQAEMVKATGISRSTYCRLERGLIDNPPLRYLVNCARVLGCDTYDLFEDEWLEWMVFDERKAQPPEPEGFWRTR